LGVLDFVLYLTMPTRLNYDSTLFSYCSIFTSILYKKKGNPQAAFLFI